MNKGSTLEPCQRD